MKKVISIAAKSLAAMVTAALLAVLFLNLSTMWSVREIGRGTAVNPGYSCAIIGSGSMEPALFMNDLLFIKGGGPYKAEDIITYVSPRGTLVTHRVREVSENGYITQGDANNIPDQEVGEQRVLGKVVFIMPGAGGIINGMLSPVGIILLVCVFLLIWLIRGFMEGDNHEKSSFDDIKEN